MSILRPKQICSKGTYLEDNECKQCPENTILTALLYPVLILVGSFGTLFLFVYFITIPFVKKYGGTQAGAFKRSTAFIVEIWSIIQILVQVSESLNKIPDLAYPLPYILEVLTYLNLQVKSTPISCLTIRTFLLQIIIFSIILVTTFIYLILFLSKNPTYKKIQNYIVAILFFIYGPLTNQLFKILSFKEKNISYLEYIIMDHDGTLKDYDFEQGIRSVIVSAIQPSVIYFEGYHKISLLLSTFCILFYGIIVPLSMYLSTKASSKNLLKTYNIAESIQTPLFVSNTLNKTIKKRIDRDLRFKRDPLLVSLTRGTYKTSRSLFKLIDISLLFYQSFLVNGLIGSFGFHPALSTFSILGFITYIFLLINYKPHTKEMHFLFSSKLVFYATSSTIIVSSMIPNTFHTSTFGYLIIIEIVVCLCTILISYIISLIEGQKKEKLFISESMRFINDISKMVDPKDIQDYIQVNSIDCIDALFEIHGTTYESVKNKIINAVNNSKQNEYQIINPILNFDEYNSFRGDKRINLFKNHSIKKISFKPSAIKQINQFN
jgi:hypothetical protein